MSDELNVWFAGPIGVGYILAVDEFPQEDRGVFVRGIKKGLVWDCSIVAKLVSPGFCKTLIGNNLGTSEDAGAVRTSLEQADCKLIEIGTAGKELPLDVVIVSGRGTRTWLSNIVPPDLNSLITELRHLGEMETPNVFYTDHWVTHRDDIISYLSFINSMTCCSRFYNLGDCNEIDDVELIIANLVGPAVVQVSFGRDWPSNSFNGINISSKNKAVIITRGEKEVLLKTSQGTTRLMVEEISGINTAGAGAFMSVSLVEQLVANCDSWPGHLVEMTEIAIERTHKVLEKQEFPQALKD